MAKQCVTCSGVYEATNPDGTEYYHACAPRKRARVLELDGSTSVVFLANVGVRPIIEFVYDARSNGRDENLRRRRLGEPRAIRAEGAGVSTV